MKPETAISRDIQAALTAVGIPCIRVQSGKVKVRGGWMQLADEGTPDLWTPWGWLEVKTAGGLLRPAQESWRERMARWGVRVATVTSARAAVDVALEWRANAEHERAMGWPA